MATQKYLYKIDFHTMPEKFISPLCRQANMLALSCIILLSLFLPICNCVSVEISLRKDNESQNIKLLCGPRSENLNPSSEHTVLWHGTQFGNDEHQKLTDMLPDDALVPKIAINSSNRHLCYLLAAKDSPYSIVRQKKRVLRDSLGNASIPVEKGVCPAGHRINGDRCFPCFPGSYTSGQDTECFLCPKDFYVSKVGADSCWPCPEGKKTLAQGSDSEESCIYLDQSGHPVAAEKPPWILIYSFIGVIIFCIWTIIVILLVRHFKGWNRDLADEVERGHSKGESRQRKPLLRTSGKKDESISDSSSAEQHVYADIGDYDDIYEVPRKPSDPAEYLDLDAPQLPPKRLKGSSKARRKSVDSDLYEVPIKKTSDAYEIPIKKSPEPYEIPVKKSKDPKDVPKAKYSDHLYEFIDFDDNKSNEKEFDTDGEENERYLSKSHSMGFEPSPGKDIRRSSSDGSVYAGRKYSSENPKYKKEKSKERMTNIPEETENIYDTPASDSS